MEEGVMKDPGLRKWLLGLADLSEGGCVSF